MRTFAILLLSAIFFSPFLLPAQSASKAFKALEAKDYEGAKVQFDQLIVLDENDIGANFGLSRIFLAKGFGGNDTETALTHLTKADKGYAKADDKVKKQLDKMGVNSAAMAFHRKNVEKRFFNGAKEVNTIEAYEAFMDRFASSSAKAQATKARNKLAYDRAATGNTVASWSTFISTYPTADEIKDATETRDKMALEAAKIDGTAAAFDDFVNKYPDSKYTIQVTQLLYAKAYNEAKSIGTSAAIQNYIDKYPDSHFKEMAESRRKELEIEGK